MKRPVVISIVSLVILFAIGLSWRDAESRGKRKGVERGAYLVTVLGCNDCHTPLTMTDAGPVPDMSRMLSGHPSGITMPQAPPLEGGWMWVGSATNTAFAGPWGTSYAINLTPDATGLGVYSEETFIAALKTGKQMGVGRDIMPPMPWQGYGKLDDEDLRAIYAYLCSIPASRNAVPRYEPPASSTSLIP